MTENFLKLKEARQFLEEKFGEAPAIAVVLGSGLGIFADELQNRDSVPAKDIPGGSASSVEGHKGQLIIGNSDQKKIAVLSGRIHGFEGHSPEQVVSVVRALRLWGVEKFVITNSSGSTHKDCPPGRLVLIKDHLNFTGKNPLVGKELFDGPRFPDMSDAYSVKWRTQVIQQAESLKLKFPLKEATYIGVLGPSFETTAEIRAFHHWGADIVGMSTVWEVIALQQMGAKILGISCVSNYGTGVCNQPLNHEEVLESCKKMGVDFIRLLKQVVAHA